MHNDFLCPRCHGHLRVHDHVVFTTKSRRWKGGLILMHPDVGNYEVIHHPSFKYEPGEHVDFYCPICHAKLSTDKHQNLAQVIMRDQSGDEHIVYFSQVADEQSTYHLEEKRMVSHGKDAQKYIRYLHRI